MAYRTCNTKANATPVNDAIFRKDRELDEDVGGVAASECRETFMAMARGGRWRVVGGGVRTRFTLQLDTQMNPDRKVTAIDQP